MNAIIIKTFQKITTNFLAKVALSSASVTNENVYTSHTITSVADSDHGGTKFMFRNIISFSYSCNICLVSVRTITPCPYTARVDRLTPHVPVLPCSYRTAAGMFNFKCAISTLWTIHRVRSKAAYSVVCAFCSFSVLCVVVAVDSVVAVQCVHIERGGFCSRQFVYKYNVL